MNNERSLHGSLLLLLMVTGCASSKPEQQAKGNPFDTDGDGYLTREEYAASALSDVVAFEALDANSDGLLSEQELEFRSARGSRDRGPRGGKQRRSELYS